MSEVAQTIHRIEMKIEVFAGRRCASVENFTELILNKSINDKEEEDSEEEVLAERRAIA